MNDLLRNPAATGASTAGGGFRSYTIRSVMALTFVLAILLVAWTNFIRPYQRQQAGIRTVQRLGGYVEVTADSGSPMKRLFVTAILGQDAFVQAFSIDLTEIEIDSDVIGVIARMPFLLTLTLDKCAVNDDNIAELAALQRLQSLSLKYTAITDRSATTLSKLSQLRTLYLMGTRFTDAGLENLAPLKQLNELYVRWTPVTGRAVEAFTVSHPECEVFFHTVDVE